MLFLDVLTLVLQNLIHFWRPRSEYKPYGGTFLSMDDLPLPGLFLDMMLIFFMLRSLRACFPKLEAVFSNAEPTVAQ